MRNFIIYLISVFIATVITVTSVGYISLAQESSAPSSVTYPGRVGSTPNGVNPGLVEWRLENNINCYSYNGNISCIQVNR